MRLRPAVLAASLLASTAATGSAAQPLAADGEAAFRATYKELVETDTTLSAGSCTLAAERMAARLKAAGFADQDLHLVVEPSQSKEGSLVAVLPGSDSRRKALLLLAHIDVVEANRADWERDPFTLVEEDGFFYARGASDDKAQAAVWVDTLVRFKQEGFKPKRTIKMALTCGEETAGAFNGAQYLAQQQRDLIDAEFALNEGAGGMLDDNGKPIALNIQAGEKFPQNYRLEVTNPGGHSSRPVKENAIYRLADALVKLRAYDFPILSNEATRGYFGAMSKLLPGPAAPSMAAFAADPKDAAAAATIAAADPAWNAILRTTCVATMLDGGHATNALPQRSRANVNCRIFPGTSVEAVRQELERVVGDPQVKITTLETRSEIAPPPPLTERVIGPAKKVAAEVFPGVPLVPVMAAGGTDGAFLTPAGIPTYGLTGFFSDREGSRAHGLNERMRIKSLMDGRTFLYRLVKVYAGS
ncbi:M20/M25/M40 family metallo-hydrolase [Sphingosinicella sp. BN140058]|uniref:M20/M25/M40 family metallo-hydrolase n=1 Tax=Sphingosinicella sp. BN140058 TaxID=1892855 RepID=UPI001010BB04|nr:M20/M25/M40 family metallo-hydrolase [Sphingosinicella sp. BN140058]QAY78288.1 M20/M25/M40 family metallo-hydrolase [Sphingosinicella sp. BN140058]